MTLQCLDPRHRPRPCGGFRRCRCLQSRPLPRRARAPQRAPPPSETATAPPSLSLRRWSALRSPPPLSAALGLRRSAAGSSSEEIWSPRPTSRGAPYLLMSPMRMSANPSGGLRPRPRCPPLLSARARWSPPQRPPPLRRLRRRRRRRQRRLRRQHRQLQELGCLTFGRHFPRHRRDWKVSGMRRRLRKMSPLRLGAAPRDPRQCLARWRSSRGGSPK
mmetsp:Transcript_61694/g.176939  ORF Transcript_61694/g.176939 Transcript_61694/m.176939 type:complete len:218 (-) Transcript_61694:807-1460(-)